MPKSEFFAPWHVHLNGGEIGPRRLLLLQAIANTGSVSKAAKQVGMAYKAAWEAVEIINNLAGVPLVDRQHGGKGGGGATLTAAGLEILNQYERLSALQTQWMASLQPLQVNADILPTLRRLTMQTSARNTFHGTVETVKSGPINAEVILKLQGEDRIVATITHDSLERLQLKVGNSVWALFKANWVLLASPEVKGKTSARNCLCGKVLRISKGPISAEVIVELPGGNTIASIVTEASLTNLQLTEGKPICVLIKASHVLLGVTD